MTNEQDGSSSNKLYNRPSVKSKSPHSGSHIKGHRPSKGLLRRREVIPTFSIASSFSMYGFDDSSSAMSSVIEHGSGNEPVSGVMVPRPLTSVDALRREKPSSGQRSKSTERRLTSRSAPSRSSCPQSDQEDQLMMFARGLPNSRKLSSGRLSTLKKSTVEERSVSSGRLRSVPSVIPPRPVTVGRYFHRHNGLCRLNTLTCQSYHGMTDGWGTPALHIKKIVLFHRDNFDRSFRQKYDYEPN